LSPLNSSSSLFSPSNIVGLIINIILTWSLWLLFLSFVIFVFFFLF
jgi:hypothetical protein